MNAYAGSFAATREEIELVCSYMADDQAVANYFGVSPNRVERIRSAMKESIERRIPTGYKHEGHDDGSGIKTHQHAEEDAVAGSQQLKEAIDKLFWKWEWKHGFKPGAAQILLPAGYNPA